MNKNFKINQEKITALILSGFVLVGTLGYSLKNTNDSSDNTINYNQFIDDELKEDDLNVIELFKKIDNYKNHIIENDDVEFKSKMNNEAEIICSSIYKFLFSDFTLDNMINGSVTVDKETNQKYYLSCYFSDDMLKNISYSGNVEIKFNDLSEKGKYTIIQMAKNIVFPLYEKFEISVEYDSYKNFLENSEELLLNQENNLKSDIIDEVFLGDNPNSLNYEKYYSQKNEKVETKENIDNIFSKNIKKTFLRFFNLFH